jgi:DNA repair exonuclease SbcCD nuclease subunit
MRFIHTADWQIGKSFRRYGEREDQLKRARLDAIERIGALALRENAPFVLVAGDVYDHYAPSERTANEPLERMRAFPGVTWLLLPGNHDPHRPDAIWDRLMRAGLPANVKPQLSTGAIELAPGICLLPAPLLRNSETADLTAFMDAAPTPPGALRIGLAHGSVTGFSDEQAASNPIDPARAKAAGLAYLALGDWHRTMKINDRTWYAGTPEPDRAGGQRIGQALLVDVAGPDSAPKVTALDVGVYRWESREIDVRGAELDDVEASLRAMPDLPRTLLRLACTGALPLSARADIERRLEALHAAFFHLEIDLDGVAAQPSAEDLDAIDFDGVLRKSADLLRARSDDSNLSAADRRIATDALIELFMMSEKERKAALIGDAS